MSASVMSRDPKRRANLRLALILAGAAAACYLGIYFYYLLQS